MAIIASIGIAVSKRQGCMSIQDAVKEKRGSQGEMTPRFITPDRKWGRCATRREVGLPHRQIVPEFTVRGGTRVGFLIMQCRCAPSDTRRALCFVACGPSSVRLSVAGPGRAGMVMPRKSLPP